MKILFVFPYPSGTAPSQRFRFEQYFRFLEQRGYQYRLASFLDNHTWQILYKKGHYFQKTWGILKGFLKRFWLLFSIPKYDFIFVHREATPLGYPWFEWVVAKVFRKKIIFDFDDAIWLPNTSQQNKLVAFLKFHQKTALICKWAYKISAGNQYLCDYACQFNSQVVYNPTTIDTEHLHNPSLYPKNTSEKPVIGWTGSHSTIQYLDDFIPTLEELEKEFQFTFLVISNQKPDFSLRSFEFIYWNKNTEIADLQKIDIGIMPLSDDAWAKGKCGFKALQYMALGKPALVSPVGVNQTIIENERNGFLCETQEDWLNALRKLLNNASLRYDLGKEAQQTVVKKYSVIAHQNTFMLLFT